MTGDLLVRGGTLVDGTGAPARPADVRIRDGVIAEVGAGLAPDGETHRRRGRRVRRARLHRLPHALRPVGVVGPAGRPDAAARRDHRRHRQLLAVAHAGARRRPHRASDVFGFIEDIPVDAFTTGIPWTWESYARVARRAACARHRGERGRARRALQPARLRDGRRRVDARRDRPRSAPSWPTVLADSLAAGALGLSTSFVDQDRHGNAVPSRAADDDELRALIEVLGAAPGHARVLEFLPWIKEIDRQLVDIDRVARLVRRGGRRRAPGTSWPRTAATRRAPSASSSRPTRCTPTAAACTGRCRRGRSTCT